MSARSRTRGWTRHVGLGFELAASVAGFSLVGWWLGGYWDRAETGLAIGAVLGIVGGLYNLLRASLSALRGGQASENQPEE